MKTNDEILEQLSCCTIEEDADLDVKENFYYKYEDVIKAMNEARKQVNGDSTGSGQSNIPDVSFSEAVICPDCHKYKRMQGNGILHQLCECDSEAEVCPHCKSTNTIKVTGSACLDCKETF